MARLDLHSVEKHFGAIEVLKDVNLSIADGEFIVLVGPSGCGKSTLLRMIAGLEDISAGEFLIDGQRMNEVEPRHRDIAMVFQSYALYPHMDVARNMGFSMEIRGAEAHARTSRVAAAARTLGLEKLTGRLPRALSGGQRQRVAMGRAIVREPRAFLFDEPLSNLDAALRVEMRLEIARLHKRLKATMVYVTHDQVEALTLADRIVVLNGGVIQQVGTPLELYQSPANRFVAQFIGSPTMNMLGASSSTNGASLANGIEVPITGLTGAVAELGIRPEHFDVCDPSSAPIKGLVDVIEHLGSDTNLYILADGLGPVMVRQHGHIDLQSGDKVGLSIQSGRSHAFDSDGKALRSNTRNGAST
jgi:multiple sugar transport system ATP-binding protein